MAEVEQDVNAAFDSILLSEEGVVGRGWEEGRKAGASEGRAEGARLGRQKGGEVGQEDGKLRTDKRELRRDYDMPSILGRDMFEECQVS